MTQEAPVIDRYLAQFRAYETGLSLNGTAWLHDLRAQALDRFAALGFPIARKGNEPWKYTSLAPIAREAFEDAYQAQATMRAAALRRILPADAGWIRLVFVNGRFAPDLSSVTEGDGVMAGSLAQAGGKHRDLVEPHLGRIVWSQSDGLTSLNTAFLRDGAFVHIAPGREAQAPVHIVHVAAGERAASYPRTLIVAGRASKLTIVESYAGLAGDAHFTNAVTEVALAEGASLEHHRLVLARAFHVGTTQVRQAKDSAYRSLAAARGGALTRHTFGVLLDAPGARCDLDGLYSTSGAGHLDNSTTIDHAAPRTTSRQYYKGILNGDSRAVFAGKVIVRHGAQKADAHQANRNLLLSKGAEVDTKPSLEIFADDVRCTHGATAGALDQATLFYLMSRGLDEAAARTLLVRAFAGEIIERARLKPVRTFLERRFVPAASAL